MMMMLKKNRTKVVSCVRIQSVVSEMLSKMARGMGNCDVGMNTLHFAHLLIDCLREQNSWDDY